jgi:hypothetical protein
MWDASCYDLKSSLGTKCDTDRFGGLPIRQHLGLFLLIFIRRFGVDLIPLVAPSRSIAAPQASEDMSLMKDEEHYLGVGRLVSNLQSLEFLLRIFLCEANGEAFDLPKVSTASMPTNHLTNYNSLGQLIDKYNIALSPDEANAHSVDRGIVGVRDALAHGRLCSKDEGLFPLTLYKFGKPDKAGTVPIEHVTIITADWLKTGANLASSGMQKVHGCGKVRGYKSFPA